MLEMTVKEMMEILKNYDENAQLTIYGGKNFWGVWTTMQIDDETVIEKKSWEE